MYLYSHGYSSSHAAFRYKQPLSAVTVLRIHGDSVACNPSNQIKHCPLARPVSITTQTRYQFLPRFLLSEKINKEFIHVTVQLTFQLLCL